MNQYYFQAQKTCFNLLKLLMGWERRGRETGGNNNANKADYVVMLRRVSSRKKNKMYLLELYSVHLAL